MTGKNNKQPERFKDRIIFMSMYNDIDRGQNGNDKVCLQNSSSVAADAAKYPKGHGSFLGHGFGEEWYATLAHKPDGSWNRVAELVMINFRESGYPVLRGTRAFFSEEL